MGECREVSEVMGECREVSEVMGEVEFALTCFPHDIGLVKFGACAALCGRWF